MEYQISKKISNLVCLSSDHKRPVLFCECYDSKADHEMLLHISYAICDKYAVTYSKLSGLFLLCIAHDLAKKI